MHGHNGLDTDKLYGFLHELEAIAERRQALKDEEAGIYLEAKVAGFAKPGINIALQARKSKPHDWHDKEALRAVYLSAVGMGEDLPLFRQMNSLVKDHASRDAVIDAMKALAPASGEIIVKMGGASVRIFRDQDGVAQVRDYVERAPDLPPLDDGSPRPAPPAQEAPRPRKEVPDVSDDEAEELGRQAARDNVPIVKNPFPFGDERRARWDAGWCDENGGDGMGPAKKPGKPGKKK